MGRLDILIVYRRCGTRSRTLNVSPVVNYDIPMDSESYVHRTVVLAVRVAPVARRCTVEVRDVARCATSERTMKLTIPEAELPNAELLANAAGKNSPRKFSSNWKAAPDQYHRALLAKIQPSAEGVS